MEFIGTLLSQDSLAIALIAIIVIMILRGDLVPKSVISEKDSMLDRLIEINETLTENNQKLLDTAHVSDKLLVTLNNQVGGGNNVDSGLTVETES